MTLLSVFLFSLYWCGVFRAGKPFVRLEGCYESICQVLTLRDNGVFDLETHTQSEMNTYTGSYLLNSGEIKLYNTLGEGSMENLPEELDKLTEIECIRAEGMNFRYWMSGCFKTIYFYP